MNNFNIYYKTISDGVINEYSTIGNLKEKGSSFCVNFFVDTSDFKSEYAFAVFSGNKLKITAKGDATYSISLVEKEKTPFKFNSNGYALDFEVKTNKLRISKNQEEISIFVEYSLFTGKNPIKNSLIVKCKKINN